MANSSTLTAGIDISKDKLDAAMHGLTQTLRVANDKAGWKTLAAGTKKTFVSFAASAIGVSGCGYET